MTLVPDMGPSHRSNPERSNDELVAYPQHAFQVVFLHDGTTTIAEVCMDPGYGPPRVVGRGVAKRRKGDRRNLELGEDIALARAFRVASDTYAARARRAGVEPFAVRLPLLVEEEKKPTDA